MAHRLPLAEPASTGLLVQPSAIHAALEGIVTIDDQMRIAMVNPAAERMFGYTAAELLGRELSVLMPERMRDAHAVHAQGFMASAAVELRVAGRSEMVGLRANGEEFPMESALCKVDAPDGRRYCTALLCDLSEARKLATQIDQLNERMRAIFDLVPVAIWITEGESVVYANAACARLFGSEPRDSFAGQSVFNFLSPGSHDLVRGKVVQALAQQDAVLTLNGEITRHDGTLRQVEMVVAALPDHQRTLVQMVISDITKQSQERHALLHSRRTLRELSANLVEAREEERRRIARELHDELGQRLTALKLELATLDRADDARARADRTQAMIDMVDDTVAATRRISMDLRPPMLDDLGLHAAIEWLAHDFERRTGLRAGLQLASVPELIEPKTATALYRIVQEALTNVVRHARATEVQIAVVRKEDAIEITVQDNGDGFPSLPPHSPRGSFGLIGIRERVLLLGGQLSVSNAPDGGARLVVSLPLVEAGVPDPQMTSGLLADVIDNALLPISFDTGF
jgi:two-component system, NarL family, sensor histidine kinase UhpB